MIDINPPLNSKPLLLLPPSEGKNDGEDGQGWDPATGAFGDLAEERDQVVQALALVAGGDEKLLGVKGDHLARARAANRRLVGAGTLPVWQRYTGVVWNHLEPQSIPAAQRRRIVVVSGLLGLVRGDDPVPDYRLKLAANLAPLGKLSTWWRESLSSRLARAARGAFVIDLLPKEHRAAWAPGDSITGLSVGFVDSTGKPGGHFAKAAKGRLARAILTEGIEAIRAWRDDRFTLAVTSIGSGA